MLRWAFATALALAGSAATASSECRTCHALQWQQWQRSHHAKAMAEASEATVLGQFDGASVMYNDTRFQFTRKGGKFSVGIQKAGEDGRTLPVRYTFGIYPLQQYLVPLPGGRLQALPVAWDSRDKNQGGQRWYALDSKVAWDSVGFNWNTSCAECHSTGLRKNFSAASNHFDTRWDEINVGCAACHIGSERHQAWIADGQPGNIANKGFSANLNERGSWHFPEGEPIATRKDRPAGAQLDRCAACHARRTLIADPGDQAMLDYMQLSLLQPGLYHADGQIREEVYVTGSFLQSRMHAAGVVCSDCHNPHSTRVHAPGNALCTRCHDAQTFDTTRHHHHDQTSAGAQCVNCHMPETVYMGVDARRDHRFGIPQPALTAEHGIPNACQQCHANSDAEWTRNVFAQWGYGRRQHNALASAQADIEQGLSTTLPRLLHLIDSAELSPIARASALERLAATPDSSTLAVAAARLGDGSPLVRIGAIAALENIDARTRWRLVHPLLQDEVAGVRLEAARVLMDATRRSELDAAQQAVLRKALAEYEQAQLYNADHPGSQLNLAQLYMAGGDREKARNALKQAIRIEPAFVPAYINLADLARSDGADEEAIAVLQRAIAAVPDAAAPYFALGLAEVRRGDRQQALAHLQQALQYEPENSRYAYTLAVAHEQTGDPESAIAVLEQALMRRPDTVELLDLAVRYQWLHGDKARARQHLRHWLSFAPHDASALQLQRELH